MPNRYEREIEEILRNLDRTEPKAGLSDRLRAFNQRPKPERTRPSFRVSLSRTEVLFLLGIACALVAAGIRFYFQSANTVSGMFAVVAFVAILLALVYEWSDRFRGAPPKVWRGNVVEMTPRRRPFSGLMTQLRILRLKLRYRRMRGNDESSEPH
jgi:hypothetical protein